MFLKSLACVGLSAAKDIWLCKDGNVETGCQAGVCLFLFSKASAGECGNVENADAFCDDCGVRSVMLRMRMLVECGALLHFSCRSYSNSMRPVVHLHNSITKAELFLVGIDHVSPKSADFVRHVIRDLIPNVVAVELCKSRGKALLSCQRHESMTFDEFGALKGGLKENLLHFVINELYVRLAATGLKPGEELRVAIQEGLAFGANIVYMDQDVNVTMKRTAQEFSLMELLWCVLRRKEIYRQYPVLFKAFSNGDPVQCADAMMHPKAQEEAMGFGEKYFPGLAKSLVHERNEYMVKKLRNMSGSIVGVVGALHLQGMRKLWQEAEG